MHVVFLNAEIGGWPGTHQEQKMYMEWTRGAHPESPREASRCSGRRQRATTQVTSERGCEEAGPEAEHAQ